MYYNGTATGLVRAGTHWDGRSNAAEYSASIFAAHRNTLDRLGVNHARALGWGFHFRRTRNPSRMARLIRSQVPTLSAIV
jgi:hypothetical protein